MSKARTFTPDPDSREPLRAPATWTALAGALLAVLVGFGVPIPKEAAAALVGLAAVAGPLAVWAWGRRRAWSGATVADMVTRPEDRR